MHQCVPNFEVFTHTWRRKLRRLSSPHELHPIYISDADEQGIYSIAPSFIYKVFMSENGALYQKLNALQKPGKFSFFWWRGWAIFFFEVQSANARSTHRFLQ
jgi:hypothetical protein